MKKSILFIGMLSLFVAFFSSCKKGDKPTVTVNYVDNVSTGWLGDTIKFNVSIECDYDFTLKVTNNHDSQSMEESYTAGSTTATFSYIIPTDLSEGDKIKVTFVATNTEADLAETVEKDITVGIGGSGSTITHEGTIEQDETWSAADVHVVEGSFYISGYTVTIAPGTVILMSDGASIVVGSDPNSKLIAQGTSDRPITFTSGLSEKNAGDWDFIKFESGTLSSTILEYCIFEYGGGDSNYTYMFGVDECEISVNNCTFRYSESKGIKAWYDGMFKSFKNNLIEECQDALVSIEPNYVYTLENSSVYNSTTQGIEIDADSDNYYDLENSTWYKQSVPYIINGILSIESDQSATLTIEAGTTIKMASETYIHVGNGDVGALIAVGTADEPITFTSANPIQAAGDWDFIQFNDNTLNTSKLEYCNIEYAGGDTNYDYGIKVHNCKIRIDNCTIKYSEGSAIVVDYGAEFLSFTNNTITDCNSYLIEIEPNAIHTIGTGNTLTSTDYGVHILDEDYTLTTEHTWPELTCSYIVDASISIGTEDGSGAVLRIAPGATFKMKNDADFVSGYHPAQIFFEGTAEKPITFTTAYNVVQPGQWKGLRFQDDLVPGSIMDYCNISYGGRDDNYQGNIYITQTNNLTITNCNISNSANYGIYLYDCLPANSDWQTANTFENNAIADWYID